MEAGEGAEGAAFILGAMELLRESARMSRMGQGLYGTRAWTVA